MTHTVEFAIEVIADSPAEACREAWRLLSAPDAMLPIGTVITHVKRPGDIGDIDTIDLQELADNAATSPTCNLQPAT